MKRLRKFILLALVIALLIPFTIFNGIETRAAYSHNGDEDSPNFRSAYPEQIGTKLDSCTLCHKGGIDSSGVLVGSCQYCHDTYGYDASGNIEDTLNLFGLDYFINGRSVKAFENITTVDSDGDGFNNGEEIVDTSFPGDPKDTPKKVAAPYLILTLDQIEKMPQHTQFMLMNASRSTDNYVEYSGVSLEDLIKSIKLNSATGITVYSPDGFNRSHPFLPSGNKYYVFGPYPQAPYYYNPIADLSLNPSGWCDYSAPSCSNRENGDPIENQEGLKMLLVIKREGELLTIGQLNSDNKLDGEGPFRVVPPQKTPCPPDQGSKTSNPALPWPYVNAWDHNAGESVRTVTLIRVDPLPDGTTDVDLLEAGWPYVGENKIVIYGAITSDPVAKLSTDLDALTMTIQGYTTDKFKNKNYGNTLVNKLTAIKKQVKAGAFTDAIDKLNEDILPKCTDWLTDGAVQDQLKSSVRQILILLEIVK